MTTLLAQSITPGGLTNLSIQYWGQAGLIIVALSIVVVYLYRRIEKLQDMRIVESKEYVEKNTSLARELSNTIHDLSATIHNLQYSRNHK